MCLRCLAFPTGDQNEQGTIMAWPIRQASDLEPAFNDQIVGVGNEINHTFHALSGYLLGATNTLSQAILAVDKRSYPLVRIQ